ncbi:MAG: helix-turn-helix domain-containing protein [Thermomicrobiales bacterium]
MRTLNHPQPADFTLDAVLAALADPVRREIVRCLHAASAEKACGTFGLELSPSTLTHHFRVLREAGVITQRYQGTAILNALRREDLEARFPGLLSAIIRAE